MTLETQHSLLQSELTVSQDELTTAREDARHYSEQAVETQEIYERELVNHGKSMESLCTVREQVCGLCVCCEGVCTIGVCVCTTGCHVDCVYICCEGVCTTGGHVDCVYVVRVCVCVCVCVCVYHGRPCGLCVCCEGVCVYHMGIRAHHMSGYMVLQGNGTRKEWNGVLLNRIGYGESSISHTS